MQCCARQAGTVLLLLSPHVTILLHCRAMSFVFVHSARRAAEEAVKMGQKNSSVVRAGTVLHAL